MLFLCKGRFEVVGCLSNGKIEPFFLVSHVKTLITNVKLSETWYWPYHGIAIVLSSYGGCFWWNCLKYFC